MSKLVGYVYACGICKKEWIAPTRSKAKHLADMCERLDKPAFGFEVGTEIEAQVKPDGMLRGKKRTLKITGQFYQRQVRVSMRGRKRKVPVHVPSYYYEYTDGNGNKRTNWCVESTLRRYMNGPVHLTFGPFLK